MAQTALTQVIEHMKRDVELGMSHKPTVDRLVWYIETYFIPKEKQDIIQAAHKGFIQGFKEDANWTSEEYFNQTFNQK